MKESKRTEKDLAEEPSSSTSCWPGTRREKTEDVAQILYMKATLYLQVFDHAEKGIELITQLKNDYPDTAKGKKADEIIASFKQREEAKKIQSSLVAEPGSLISRKKTWPANRSPWPITKAKCCCSTFGQLGAGRA